MTLREAFDKYYLPAHPDMKKSGIKSYREYVNSFNRHARRPDVENIAPIHFRIVASSMRQKGVGQEYINRVVKISKRIMAFLFETKVIPDEKYNGVHAGPLSRISLMAVLRKYAKEKMLSPASIEQMEIAVFQMVHFTGEFISVAKLTEDLLSAFVHWYLAKGVSPETAIRKRTSILTLWDFAADENWCVPPRHRKVAKPARMHRLPKAWTLSELKRIETSCAESQNPARGHWDGRHWVALIKVLYDTGHRLQAVIQTPMANLDFETGELLIGAETTKTNADQVHRLHATTISAIRETRNLNRKMLFPWEHHKRYIWDCFRQIVADAGLPSTRKDLFHKIRRTSFTQCFKALGKDSALEHCGHKSDMTKYYLDRSQLDRVSAIDVLPRP
jgi:site-specific recombinase XerD